MHPRSRWLASRTARRTGHKVPRSREEVHLNLAYRWFCRFGLDAIPEHLTFSRPFRDSDLSRKLFKTGRNAFFTLTVQGGVLIACDALHNLVGPDEYFSDQSRQVMQELGFFQPANIGPIWMQINEPKAEDFLRLQALPFRHAICCHGPPLRDTAREAYAARFQRTFAFG
jgi:hypothetical protein